MAEEFFIKNGSTSNMVEFKLFDAGSTVGAGHTGLSGSSVGLIISVKAPNEATATTYTQVGSTIETITTIGTYAAPTAGKVRFKEIDAVNKKGEYQLQLADAIFAKTSAKTLLVSISGVSTLVEKTFTVHLRADTNVVSISEDELAADNLEAMYDGTGYTSDSAPATQAQIGNLATGSAAISTIVESRVLTTGTEVNAATDTATLDGVYHEVSDAAGALELEYQFDVGGNGVAVDVTITGRLVGANDTLSVFARDHDSAKWDQIGTVVGSNSSTDGVSTYTLLNRHTGTGANLGKVKLRWYAASGLSSATLYVEQAFISYSVVSNSVGYAGGKVWVDTTDGTAGTESFVNGVADKTSLLFSDALIIATNIGLHQFHIAPDSTLSPAADINRKNIYGSGYTMNLGGFDYAGTHIYHASPLNGTATAQNNTEHLDILQSIVQNVNVDDVHFYDCSFIGTVTLSLTQSGDIKVVNCRSLIAGSSTPIFDFNTGIGVNHNFTAADYQNGIEIRNFNVGGTDLMSLSGCGQLVIDSTCAGGTINLRGDWKVTGEAVFLGKGGVITRDANSQNILDTLSDTNELQSDDVPALIAALPTASEAAVAVWSDTLATYTSGMAGQRLKGASVVPTLEGAVNDASATTTSFATNLTGYGDTFFKDALISIELAPNNWQARTITSYTSATGLFVLDEPLSTAPSDSVSVAVKITHVHTVAELQNGLATASSVAAIKAETALILADTASPEKNQPFNNMSVLMVENANHVTPKTGLTLSVTRSKDGGAFAAATGTASEVANGLYSYDASATDMNAGVVTFRFTATGADDTFVTVYTRL